MRRTHVEPFQHVGVPPLPRREHCDPVHAAVEIFYRYEAVIFFKLIPAVQAGEGGMEAPQRFPILRQPFSCCAGKQENGAYREDFRRCKNEEYYVLPTRKFIQLLSVRQPYA